MAWYVVLAKFTDQGMRAVKETPKRAKAFRETAGALGVTILLPVKTQVVLTE